MSDNTMMVPQVEGLLERAESKFRLVTLSSKRARQINRYFGELGEGAGQAVPPQVASTARKSLSIAFQEIAADKIVPVEIVEGAESADDADTSDGVDETA
jgi:DNA-directed RNA polymerase subunit omega